jgi:hypothetical protein
MTKYFSGKALVVVVAMVRDGVVAVVAISYAPLSVTSPG